MSKEISQATLFQTQFVMIESNVLSDAKDEVVSIPLIIPNGPDWEYLKPEQLRIDYADVMITPYYDQAIQVNQTVGKGVVTGNFPIYMTVYAGNTMFEQEPTEISQMIYNGVYITGSQNSTTKVELKGTVFKTLGAEGDVVDKEAQLHKWFDATQLNNKKVKLQLGRVAIGIRKDDFKAVTVSGSNESSSALYEKMRCGPKEVKEPVKKIVKGKVVHNDDIDYDCKTYDVAENGKLMARAGFYITTKVQVSYNRNPIATGSGSGK